VESVQLDLQRINPLLKKFQDFIQFQPDIEDASMKILDPGATNEIAAIYNVGSGATHEPQCLYVHC